MVGNAMRSISIGEANLRPHEQKNGWTNHYNKYGASRTPITILKWSFIVFNIINELKIIVFLYIGRVKIIVLIKRSLFGYFDLLYEFFFTKKSLRVFLLRRVRFAISCLFLCSSPIVHFEKLSFVENNLLAFRRIKKKKRTTFCTSATTIFFFTFESTKNVTKYSQFLKLAKMVFKSK